ncbi:hypothetical protein OQA88_5372 [Cercophora sp. LCS_1]
MAASASDVELEIVDGPISNGTVKVEDFIKSENRVEVNTFTMRHHLSEFLSAQPAKRVDFRRIHALNAPWALGIESTTSTEKQQFVVPARKTPTARTWSPSNHEDYVYDNPDNDSCTPELWICSKYLRSYEMLLQSHHEFLKHYFDGVRWGLRGQPSVEFNAEAVQQIEEHIAAIRDSFKPSMEYMLDMVRSPQFRRRPALS